MKRNIRYISLLLVLVLAGACTYDFPTPEQKTSGTADFSKYVAIGNSLTAGFMNGALYNEGQKHSYPVILAQQMKAVGGGDFNVPDINSENGYYGTTVVGGNPVILGRLYLKGTTSPTPTPKIPGEAPTAFTGDKSKLNNFGVPGVTLLTALIPQTGGPSSGNPAYNPLYARFASNPGTSTLVGDAAAALQNGGTFFTFWLGNNDVLGYAIGGASNPTLLTSNTDFVTRLTQALGAMLNANPNAEGAVANIPDVTSIPFFSTVSYNPIPLDGATASNLNTNLAANYNAFLDGMVAMSVITKAEADKRKLNFTASKNNNIVIDDETLTDLDAYMAGPYAGLKPYHIARQTTSSDRVTLTAGSVIGTTVGGDPNKINGVTVPLSDAYILLPSEATEVQQSVDAFNTAIASAVSSNSDRLVLVDINTLLKNLKQSGAIVNGSSLTATISPPFGGFSLDGVHPNARGMAYLANEFIRSINAKFKSNIPLCNPNDYAGNELPVP
jgi:hypothetical protein